MSNGNNGVDTSVDGSSEEKKERKTQQTSSEGLAIFFRALTAQMKHAGVADPEVLLRRAQKDIRKNKDAKVLPKVLLMISDAVSEFDTDEA